MTKKIILFLFITISFYGYSQDGQNVKLHYWGNVDEFINEQTRQTFMLINQILDENPPEINETLIRKSALYSIDAILHDPRLNNNDLIYQFMDTRIKTVVKDMELPVKKGAKIYKLYNDGFVIKTASVTFAMDINRGVSKEQKPLFSDELLKQIVDKCDILFVSHSHSDHYDIKCIELFIEAQKPVIAPPDFLKDNESKYIKRYSSASFSEILELDYPISDKKTINIKILPGHQDNIINNMYVVKTPEDISFAHTGDQWNKEDTEWIPQIKNKVKTDILLVHCWSIPLENIVNGFSPRIVITGHENELMHSIDHREPYWLNYERMKNITIPKIFMTWGENYYYIDENF